MDDKKIQDLNISDTIKSILADSKIKTIKQICKKSKADLKEFGLTNSEINQINVQLQLIGFKLKDSL